MSPPPERIWPRSSWDESVLRPVVHLPEMLRCCFSSETLSQVLVPDAAEDSMRQAYWDALPSRAGLYSLHGSPSVHETALFEGRGAGLACL